MQSGTSLWLMPPSVRNWLPDEHLAWFVLDVVAELDLAEFYAPYRSDGRDGAAANQCPDHATLARFRAGQPRKPPPAESCLGASPDQTAQK
jgi:hypothetical protein